MLTVTTPAPSLALLTAAELRSAINVTDGSQDAALATLGARVAAAITAACRVRAAGVTPPTLRQESLSETFRVHCPRSVLILGRKPVTSIESVTIDDEEIEAEDYELDDAAGVLRRAPFGGWDLQWQRGSIVVEYTAGWAVVPELLKMAAAKFVQSEWAEASDLDPNMKSVSIPGVMDWNRWVAPKEATGVPAEVISLLVAGGFVEFWV